MTYDSGEGYTDKAAAAWTSVSNSTLTVAIPTGAEARKLTVQPMAVKLNGAQITGLTYGDVYEVYTNRAAKATTPTISNVYSDAPTYKIARDQLATLEAEETRLRAQYEEVFDQGTLQAAVASAGGQLSEARSDQKIYVDLSEPDNAVVYSQSGEKSLLQSLKDLWKSLTE